MKMTNKITHPGRISHSFDLCCCCLLVCVSESVLKAAMRLRCTTTATSRTPERKSTRRVREQAGSSYALLLCVCVRVCVIVCADERGCPLVYTVNSAAVIPGLEQCVTYMQAGEKCTVVSQLELCQPRLKGTHTVTHPNKRVHTSVSSLLSVFFAFLVGSSRLGLWRRWLTRGCHSSQHTHQGN